MSALAPALVVGAPRVRRGGAVGLLALAALLFVGSAALLPLAAHLFVGAAALVVAMVVAHDAIHSAAHARVELNRAIGWLASLACGVPFVMLASNHLRHHRLVDTAEDPERFCLGPAWQLPVRGAAMLGFYYVDTWPRLDARARRSVVLFVAVELLALALAPALVVLWLAPLALAAIAFATCTVWLPHGPLAAAVMRVAPWLTGYHDDHHARPAVPSLQYGELHRWHVATGVVTRRSPTPEAVGTALGAALAASAGLRAVRLDERLLEASAELQALTPWAVTRLRLERRGVLPARPGVEVDQLLTECVRRLSLHPRVRAQVERGLEAGTTVPLRAVVLDVARLLRGEGPAAFDASRQVALAVGTLAALLSRVRLDVRVGSPVKPRPGLEVRVHARAA